MYLLHVTWTYSLRVIKPHRRIIPHGTSHHCAPSRILKQTCMCVRGWRRKKNYAVKTATLWLTLTEAADAKEGWKLRLLMCPVVWPDLFSPVIYFLNLRPSSQAFILPGSDIFCSFVYVIICHSQKDVYRYWNVNNFVNNLL